MAEAKQYLIPCGCCRSIKFTASFRGLRGGGEHTAAPAAPETGVISSQIPRSHAQGSWHGGKYAVALN